MQGGLKIYYVLGPGTTHTMMSRVVQSCHGLDPVKSNMLWIFPRVLWYDSCLDLTTRGCLSYHGISQSPFSLKFTTALKYESYMVITTHSCYFYQELPSSAFFWLFPRLLWYGSYQESYFAITLCCSFELYHVSIVWLYHQGTARTEICTWPIFCTFFTYFPEFNSKTWFPSNIWQL